MRQVQYAVLILAACILMLPAWARATPTHQLDTGKRVLVLYSMPLDFPATKMTEQGIHEGFGQDGALPVQIYAEYLNLSRFRDTDQRGALADLLRHRYADGRIDLVIGVDVPTATFLLENAQKVFPGLPLVLCELPEHFGNRIRQSPLKNCITAILEPASNSRRLVESAFALKPEAKHAVLISGAFESDGARAVALREAIETREPDVKLIDLSGLSLGELLKRCQSLPKDSLIFFSTFFVDIKGRSFVPKEVIQSIAAHTNLPIFGPYTSYMGGGIVGGPLTSLRLEGKKAAQAALQLLQNPDETPASLEVSEDLLEYLYDWRQLRQHNISESLLPSNVSVLYREETIWDTHKNLVIAAMAVLALQFLLIVGLIVNLQRRKKAESALLASQQELRTLAGRLISSQEEELSRLGREFHDDLAQRLAAVAIETGTLERQAGHLDAPDRFRIGHIKEQLIGLSEDVHAISRELHPTILKDLGLERAVNSLCVSFSSREGIPVGVHLSSIPAEIKPDPALCVYRVIQEALRNVAKHARAQRVDVFLKGTKKKLLLTIEDDGMGFAPQNVRHTPGIGLASMRERVQHVCGEFAMYSEPDGGTIIEVSVPLQGDI